MQKHDRDAADGGSAQQNRAIPAEMPFPLVPSRVEQGGQLAILSVARGDVRPLNELQ